MQNRTIHHFHSHIRPQISRPKRTLQPPKPTLSHPIIPYFRPCPHHTPSFTLHPPKKAAREP